MILIPEGKIIDKKIGNSFHRFYVNDMNEFTKLTTRIDRISKIGQELTTAVISAKTIMKDKKMNKNKQSLLESAFRSIIHEVQLSFYAGITGIASEIEIRIQSTKIARLCIYVWLRYYMCLTD